MTFDEPLQRIFIPDFAFFEVITATNGRTTTSTH